MEKLRLNIDGREMTGYRGQTILEVALENGIQIPTFCYDKRMDTYGSCGICVVEMEGSPKLLRSCSTEIAEGMVIKTRTSRVIESRKVNLELMLSQHIGDCRAPCVLACPAQTDCQGYAGLIANGEFEEAIKLIKDKIPLAASIGRVCPHPCETACRRNLVDEPVSILNLKRFAADMDLSKAAPYLPRCAESTGKTVAIIGGGPGGLSAAWFLALKGHSVTVYDAMPKMGGMLRYGIPEYRLPKLVVDKEAALIEALGVTYKNNVKVGRDVTFESLKSDYDAVVVAIGAWVSSGLRCPGEDLDGVYGGIDFLRRVVANEPVEVGKTVAVVGGGNTAMDACRTAIRLGAERVYNIYRRTKAEMPAEEIEITEAEEEGVVFKYLVNPLEAIGASGRVKTLRLQKMRLGEPDASGRRKPEPIEGDEEMLEVDTVIAALGQGINPDGFAGLSLTRGNTIVADEGTFTTNVPGVFAIGDCANDGASIAIAAIGNAKKAVAAVDTYLAGGEPSFKAPYRVMQIDLTEEDFAEQKREPRSHLIHLSADERRDNFLEINEALTVQAAKCDADRCLECGCHDFFECRLIGLAEEFDVKPERFKESVKKVEFTDDHPFIIRDPNKCILCGLCVRVCDELVGSTALGLVGRGYDTVVMPSFENPLCETTCVSCGQCVSVCPTGALQERMACGKPVPVETDKTDSVCGMCSVGCSMRIESSGNMLVKTVPDEDRGTNSGMMCGRGRFGINLVQSGGRITHPMIRRNGQFEWASWYDAFVFAAKKLESLRIRGEKTAFAVGQSYTVEDAGAIKSLADLFGAQAMSFANRANGLALVLGRDASPNTLEEVLGADGIIVFGTSMLSNTVILSKLRHAAKRGAKITVVTDKDAVFNLPCNVITAQDSTGFIQQTVKALIDLGCAPKFAEGFDELKAALAKITPSDDAKALAAGYKSAKKAMVLFALTDLSPAGALEIANMAVVSGHIGSPRDGIYMQRQMAGSQVLADLGITAGAESASGAKGLVIFGEDVKAIPESAEFIMVQDSHMTETAKRADVVFPMMLYPELCGTFVSTERRLQSARRAVEPPIPYATREIAQKIAEIIEGSAPAGDTALLYPGCTDGECWPAPVLYTDGFEFDNKKARLRVMPELPMFEAAEPTSYLMNAIVAALPVPATTGI